MSEIINSKPPELINVANQYQVLNCAVPFARLKLAQYLLFFIQKPVEQCTTGGALGLVKYHLQIFVQILK
jgi:hypothetical protein